MRNINSLEEIKEAMIKSCLTSRPQYSKPYLYSDKIQCDSDKEGFYKFFKYVIRVSKKISEGELFLKIELPDPVDNKIQWYYFHDHVYKHPRLTIIVKKYSDSIYFEVMPF